MNKCGARSGVVKGNGSCQAKCHARGFEAWFQAGRMLLEFWSLLCFCPFLVLSVLQQLFLGYKHRVLVIGTRAPNAMLIIPTCLRGIARKITFASKRLAVSQLQRLCSVLCSCIMFFVFIINYSLIEFISFSYILFL